MEEVNEEADVSQVEELFPEVHQQQQHQQQSSCPPPGGGTDGGAAKASLVHTTDHGPPVAGLTVFNDLLFVLRKKSRDQIEVYRDDGDLLTLVGCIHIRRFHKQPYDLTSCQFNSCLYVLESGIMVHSSVFKVDSGGLSGRTGGANGPRFTLLTKTL